MSKSEIRERAYWQSYLPHLPNCPSYFADFFETVFASEETLKIDKHNEQYLNFSCDTVEKLGFVKLSAELLFKIDDAARNLFPTAAGSSQQIDLSRLLAQQKYHTYMFIWSTRSLIDALSVHLNEFWKLEKKKSAIWLGNESFHKELNQKRPTLAGQICNFSTWFKQVDTYRLYSIHREPLLVLPNADPTTNIDWKLCVPQTPEGNLISLIKRKNTKLIPLLPVVQEWTKHAETVTELIFNDTLSALMAEGAS